VCILVHISFLIGVGTLLFGSVPPPPPLPRWAATLQFVIPSEAEGSAVLSPAKQLRRVKALKAAELLDGEAHRRSLGCPGFPVKAGGVANSMRFSLQKTAHAALSSAANRKSGYAPTARRGRRDDKFKGGGPPWQWWRRRDRTSTTVTNPVSVCFIPTGTAGLALDTKTGQGCGSGRPDDAPHASEYPTCLGEFKNE
jgi:hypothetical protein